MRTRFDYGDIIYDQPNNESLKKSERIRYNTALVTTGVVKKLSQSKLYNESGFESLKFRRWFSKLCNFYCLIDNTRSSRKYYNILQRVYKYSFFPNTVQEWNKLNKKYSNLKR